MFCNIPVLGSTLQNRAKELKKCWKTLDSTDEIEQKQLEAQGETDKTTVAGGVINIRPQTLSVQVDQTHIHTYVGGKG